jgi:hypothetical protein
MLVLTPPLALALTLILTLIPDSASHQPQPIANTNGAVHRNVRGSLMPTRPRASNPNFKCHASPESSRTPTSNPRLTLASPPIHCQRQ